MKSLIFLLTCFILLRASTVSGESLKDVLSSSGIYLKNSEYYSVEKTIQGYKKLDVTAAQKGRIIKCELIYDISETESQKYISDRLTMINSMYRSIPSPYPGMISNAIEVPQDLKPKLRNINIAGSSVIVTILPSTSRFTYGARDEDLITYRGGLVFYYFAVKKILCRIDMFIPKQDYSENEITDTFSSLSLQKDITSPNLLIIAFEPLGANHIGAYGYNRDVTPALDAFAENSYLFKNTISASCWTLPAFMSIFTSLYPSQHKITNKYSTFSNEMQVFSDLRKLAPYVVTLAQLMKGNGYATAGFTGDAGLNGHFGYDLGFDLYFDSVTFGGFDNTMPIALDWVKEHKNEKFFVFVQGYDVHPRHKAENKKNIDKYWELRNRNLEGNNLHLTGKEVGFWRNWYDKKIVEADKRFGDFMDQYGKMGLLENTVVIVISGSGNEFYEHKGIDHGLTLYDELIRVPFIMKVPGEKGKTIENQVRTVDIMPTILDIFDIKFNGHMEGVSLIPLMRGQELKLDAFSETDYILSVFKRSLRTYDGWKLIYSLNTEQKELYDIKSDPGEHKNVIETSPKAYVLEKKLNEIMDSLGQDSNSEEDIINNMLQMNK